MRIMETTTVYWGYLGLFRDNGKENGNYYLGFRVEGLGFGDNRKENGNYRDNGTI